jgi:hypothetical protein
MISNVLTCDQSAKKHVYDIFLPLQSFDSEVPSLSHLSLSFSLSLSLSCSLTVFEKGETVNIKNINWCCIPERRENLKKIKGWFLQVLLFITSVTLFSEITVSIQSAFSQYSSNIYVWLPFTVYGIWVIFIGIPVMELHTTATGLCYMCLVQSIHTQQQ